MKTLIQRCSEFRSRTDSRILDELEHMLNATKASGATPALCELALEKRLTLIVHSEKWANELKQKHPKLIAKSFDSVLGRERALYDNGLLWLCVREAQALRRLSEDLLNYIEQKQIKEPK